MKLFVDECFPRTFVAHLRDKGHDVVWAGILCPGAEDLVVLQRATNDGRIILTEDRDFGTLLFKDGHSSVGIASLYASQFPGGIKACSELLADQVTELGTALVGMFTVIEPRRVRPRPLPKVTL